MWDSFISKFCEAEFLCYQGDPNWVGWVVLVLLIIILIAILSPFLLIIFDVIRLALKSKVTNYYTATVIILVLLYIIFGYVDFSGFPD